MTVPVLGLCAAAGGEGAVSCWGWCLAASTHSPATPELPGEAALRNEYLLCLDWVRLGNRQHKVSASFQHC